MSDFQLVDLPDDVVADSATFKMLQTHVQYLSGEYETKRQEAERAVKEADGFREGMEAFREDVIVSLSSLRSVFPSACVNLTSSSGSKNRPSNSTRCRLA